MSVKKNIAIIADDFALGSPAQQILDRFLIGYTRDGIFENRPFETVTVYSRNGGSNVLEQRHDFPCKLVKSVKEAVSSADAAIIMSHESAPECLENARTGMPIFVYGLLAKTKKDAEALIRKAEERNISICAGTEMSTLQELPPLEIPNMVAVGAQIREALIVVEGSTPDAEAAGFDAIAPILDRNGAMRDIRHVRNLEGQGVWDAGDRSEWSWRLLASALSRTDKAQGNTLLDGRTEDIVGLKLTQKMAKDPRARIIEYSHGVRTTILVLDGVVGDILVAVKAGRRLMPGSIYSTQMFRSPSPQQEHFSRLVATIVDYFTAGNPPWDLRRALVAADFADWFGK